MLIIQQWGILKLKNIIRQCLANDWIDKDPFIAYKMKSREVNRVFLSEKELNTTSNKEFSVNRLIQVRDLFLFSCFTGLSYADVIKLNPSDLLAGSNNERWVCTSRTKTKTASMILFIPPAIVILEKYSKNPELIANGKVLPGISNQRINSYVKEIADVCGISKKFTFHIARHTFAITVTLSNGVLVESCSNMPSHKILRTTQHYAESLDTKVVADMQVLRKRYAN